MQSTDAPRLRYTLPVFVIFSLAGFYFIVLHMALSHAPDRFLEVHKASFVPLSLTPAFPIPLLDKLFTPLVSFFVAAFGDVGRSSPSYPITLDFVWSFGAAIQLPLIEACRPGASSSWLLSIPMVWGILYQRVSGGWVLPLWLLVWMHSRARTSGKPLKRVDAESVLAGWWVGHSVPALLMLIPGMPPFRSAPIWIAFPILMSLGQHAYLALARVVPAINNRRDTSGYVPTQLVFLSSLALGAIAHTHNVIIPGLNAMEVATSMSTSDAILIKLRALLVHMYEHYVPPSFAIPSPEETTAITGVKHFVQFDVLIVFGSVWVAGIWDLALRHRELCKETKGVVVYVASVTTLLLTLGLFFGPGVATACLFAWREKFMESARHREEDSPVTPMQETTPLLRKVS